MKCWDCGVAPDAIIDATRLSNPTPRYVVNWPPAGDHEHAETPPTPQQLDEAGHDVLLRVRDVAIYG